jgi:hemolysin D
MSWFERRFPTLARNGRIFRESWRQQNIADLAFKPHSDHEFLPAALEIVEKPPSPGLRWLMLGLCGFFVLAILWSIFGKVDIVAVAGGKTIPAGSVKVIQPIEIGAVRAIHVANGQFVRKGQLLIELDPTIASADEDQSGQALLSAQMVQARNEALMRYLAGGSGSLVATPGMTPGAAATERQFVRTAIAEYEAEQAALRQQRAQSSAELAGSAAEIAKLREALPYIDRQLAARNELADKGYFSKLRLLEYEQLRAEHLRNIDVQSANAARARASIANFDAQIARLRESFGKTAVTDLVEANDRAAASSADVRRSERRRRFQELRSPVDGVVQQLTVTTIGGVVQPAQALMAIVPCRAAAGQRPDPAACTSAVEVEAFVQNKDIGFVKPGQRTAVKLEAFNFTDYGLIDGTVEFISRDAIDLAQRPAGAVQDARGRPEQQGLVYAARIRLNCAPGDPRRIALCARVQPGMSVQAEIKTGKRRIIQYLLSPIGKAVGEAGRER